MRAYINLVVFIILALIGASCSSYHNVNKKAAIDPSLLSQLKVNKKYKFELASGRTIRLRIDSIKGERIYGRTFRSGDVFISKHNPVFSDSFENIENNVVKIYRRKFNPFLTILAVGGVAFLCFIFTNENGLTVFPGS